MLFGPEAWVAVVAWGTRAIFFTLFQVQTLLINILDGPREFLGKSCTVGPDEKTKRVIRQKFGVTLDVHNFGYGSPFQAHSQPKRTYGR